MARSCERRDHAGPAASAQHGRRPLHVLSGSRVPVAFTTWTLRSTAGIGASPAITPARPARADLESRWSVVRGTEPIRDSRFSVFQGFLSDCASSASQCSRPALHKGCHEFHGLVDLRETGNAGSQIFRWQQNRATTWRHLHASC